MHINSVLMILTQLGVGPTRGFSIQDRFDTGSDFIPDSTNIDLIKSYVYLNVKLLFDPPLSSAVIDSINRQISEFEYRINIAAESSLSSSEVIN